MTDRKADPKLERDSRGFLDSGMRILLIGVAVAVAGGMIGLVGTVTTDWIAGLGLMIATLGVVAIVVGVVLLLVAAVTHRMAGHRPFA